MQRGRCNLATCLADGSSPRPAPVCQLLRGIEEHLGATVTQVPRDMAVPVDSFDGHVVYGQARGQAAATGARPEYLEQSTADLARLEHQAQVRCRRHPLPWRQAKPGRAHGLI